MDIFVDVRKTCARQARVSEDRVSPYHTVACLSIMSCQPTHPASSLSSTLGSQSHHLFDDIPSHFIPSLALITSHHQKPIRAPPTSNKPSNFASSRDLPPNNRVRPPISLPTPPTQTR
ncbi:hypothetical protein ACMFMG_001596 [Clarireedia jacksonii]